VRRQALVGAWGVEGAESPTARRPRARARAPRPPRPHATHCAHSHPATTPFAAPVQVGAVEAFATLMLMGYSVFLGMTYQFRNTLLPPPMTGGDAEQGGLPPATQFGSSEGQFAGNSGGFTDASIGGSSNLPGGVL
jgi:hypothetical protein